MTVDYPKRAVNEYRSIYHFSSELADLSTGLTIGLWQDVIMGHWTYEAAFEDFKADYEHRYPGLVNWDQVKVEHQPF